MKKFFETVWTKLNNIKILKSLKFRISILVVAVGVVCCVIMRFGVLENYFSRAVEVRTSDVQSQMKILADHLVSFNYLDDPTSGIVNAEIEQVANLYDGRVIVVGPNYSIVKDTYTVATGKIIISEEVIRTFRGELISNYDEENNYIEITVPITRNIDGKNKIVGVILTSVSTTPINQNVDILSRNSLLFMFTLLVFVLTVSFFIPRIMLRPFNRLTNAISEMKSGFTDKPIEVNDYIETEHIADAFNQVMDRMRVIEESRQEFVSNVSHELKTPLTSVKVLADSLNNQEDVPVEVYKDFMQDIVAEIDRENTIINDLLSMVKLDRKNPNINISQVNVNSLIESVFKRLLPIAKKSRVDLIFESVRQVTAELDEVKFSLAITNLVENGIKYNHEDGYVKVTLDADYQTFTITVNDSGMGIPEEDLKNIFERFYRVDKSHSREIGGTGLGLSICRSAVLLHRGTISVESKEDIGTTFTVNVPLIYAGANKIASEIKSGENDHLEHFVEVPVKEMGAESVTEVAATLLEPGKDKTGTGQEDVDGSVMNEEQSENGPENEEESIFDTEEEFGNEESGIEEDEEYENGESGGNDKTGEFSEEDTESLEGEEDAENENNENNEI